MSSWLSRVAACYQMELPELLAHDLGYSQLDELDSAPPLSLLTALARRSGVELERLRGLSFSGWVPWLFDSLDDSLPAALETYAFQCAVLLPKRNARFINRWRAWLPHHPIRRACPQCLSDPADQAVLLVWQLPLMLSCPLHGCWLESYRGPPGRYLQWENAEAVLRSANEAIACMDRRTWQALTTGFVELPRRRIHAGLWFRLLRALLDELNTPLSLCGSGAGGIRLVWDHCGYPLRAKQNMWRPFEVLDLAVQLQMLEAAAAAIALIESKTLIPRGEQAVLFQAEPQTGFTDGKPPKKPKPEPEPETEPVNHWQRVAQAFDEAITEARHNPEAARSLFAMASYGRRDPESLERLRDMFAKEGVPPEFLSHYEPQWPFAGLRLNDGLSDDL